MDLKSGPSGFRSAIGNELQKLLEDLALENGLSKTQVIKHALTIMSLAQENPRSAWNNELSETFEKEIISQERRSLEGRLYVPRALDKRLPPSEISSDVKLSSKTNNSRKTHSPRRVFISYAREDIKIARHLYRKLKSRGHLPWLDAYSLKKGADWEFEIRTSISQSAFFLAVISAASVKKTGFVQIEVQDAAKQQSHRPQGAIYFIPFQNR